MLDYKDAVRLFAQDCLLGDTKARSKPSDLHHVYLAYCHQLELPAVAVSIFSKELGKFIHSTRGHGSRRFWCKIRPDLIVEDRDEQTETKEGAPVSN